MTSALAIILVLGGLIFFHELGHFIMARLFGVGVTTFSLGFGPRIFGWRWGKTDYRVSAVPLGGYVSMVGEGEESGGEGVEGLPEGFEEHESFANKPAWQRMIVVAAGPVANFILAFLIYLFLFVGDGQIRLLPEVGEVREGSAAAEAGFEPGDMIRNVDGQPIDYWSEFQQVIRESDGSTLTFSVQRDDTTLTLRGTPRVSKHQNIFGEEVRIPLMGVLASGQTVSVPLGPLEAVGAAFEQTGRIIWLTVQSIIKLIERVIPMETVGGPIMIAQLISEGAQQSVQSVLVLAAAISINLGIINLLPIPVLDGGHILFFLYESLTGRKPSERVQSALIRVGLLFILCLMALAIYNDIVRIFTQGS